MSWFWAELVTLGLFSGVRIIIAWAQFSLVFLPNPISLTHTSFITSLLFMIKPYNSVRYLFPDLLIVLINSKLFSIFLKTDLFVEYFYRL